MPTSPVGSTDFRNYFADIVLDVEEPMVEATPLPKKKIEVEVEKKMVYNYPELENF